VCLVVWEDGGREAPSYPIVKIGIMRQFKIKVTVQSLGTLLKRPTGLLKVSAFDMYFPINIVPNVRKSHKFGRISHHEWVFPIVEQSQIKLGIDKNYIKY
ncbi:MAG: hypothetical protein ACP5J4_02245, partial [Anaerolineae bacterium]